MINCALGLFSPFKYGLREYEGYDITKFKNNIRFLEVMEDRDNGGSGQVCPLLFNGATNIFKELPLPGTPELQSIYDYLESRNKVRKTMFLWAKKLLKN